MITGLVLGKFYPFHKGHIGLIQFAKKQCDQLIVLICASDKETITGSVRLKWLEENFIDDPEIKPTLLNYSEKDLPNTSVSSEKTSATWAAKISSSFTGIDIVFSSEPYGAYLANFLKCRHISYDPLRTIYQISSSAIRKDIFKYWDFIAPPAQPYFVKKICICGTESTGKSILAEKLAKAYHTAFVPEMAREILLTTDDCTPQHLIQIAALQAATIQQKIQLADKFLFVDTDINTTRSYSRFLFGKELLVPQWVNEANHFDLYLFLENDAPYTQDGTRLDRQRRDQLNLYHREELANRKIKIELITGNWEERFEKAVLIIEKFFLSDQNI